MAIAPADSSHDRPPSLSDDGLGSVSDAVLHVMSILFYVSSYLPPNLYKPTPYWNACYREYWLGSRFRLDTSRADLVIVLVNSSWTCLFGPVDGHPEYEYGVILLPWKLVFPFFFFLLIKRIDRLLLQDPISRQVFDPFLAPKKLERFISRP